MESRPAVSAVKDVLLEQKLRVSMALRD